MIKPQTLATETWRLFLTANANREDIGGARDLRVAQARRMLADPAGVQFDADLPDDMGRPTPWCGCDPEANESCDVCEEVLPSVCTAGQAVLMCKDRDDFAGLAHKLTMVKSDDFLAAADSFYAPVGNKPAQLKANPIVDVPPEEMAEAASVFYDYLQSFLDDNQVTVDEIPDAFNLSSMNDLVDDLARTARTQLQRDIQEGLDKAESLMEAAFNRSKLMEEYLKVLGDISNAPIGAMWFDQLYLTKDYKAGRGGLTTKHTQEPVAHRVNPANIWFTSDWTEDRCGRAVFTTRQFSYGDLVRIQGLVNNTKMEGAIRELLEQNEQGYRMYSTQLFYDTMTMDNGLYDVLIARATFPKEMITDMGIDVPAGSKDTFFPVEVWYANGSVLAAHVLPDWVENLGVYTTTFRTFGNSLYGISLYDFIIPFAKMYEGAIRGVDTSAAKAAGSIISMDIGVIEDPGTMLSRNKETGAYELDLSDDTIIQFDSTEASLSPNWKGMPLQIDQLPSHLQDLIPAISVALEQIEIISGIPSIISSGSPDSSAVRTNDSYRTAHQSASKKIASLLKRSKDRVLKRMILVFYRALVDKGLLADLPIDINPELLMDERLSFEVSSQQTSGLILNDLGPFMDRIPVETVNSLINTYARSVHGIDYDVIPGSNPVGNEPAAQPTGSI